MLEEASSREKEEYFYQKYSPFLNTILLTILVSQLSKTTRPEVSPNKPTITTIIIRRKIRSIDSRPWVRVTWSIPERGGPKYAWVGWVQRSVDRDRSSSRVYSLTAEAKIEEAAANSRASRLGTISIPKRVAPLPPLSRARQPSTRARNTMQHGGWLG